MNTDTRYNKTLYACFTGYIVQAIVNNFVPLLFLTFQSQYHIPLFRITMLVTMNFGLQLLIDFSAWLPVPSETEAPPCLLFSH